MRRVLSLAASVALALVLVAALELGLRAVGMGDPHPAASRLKYQQVFLPVLVPAELADGTPVLRTTDPRLPYAAVPREKPPRELRVVTLGGSAMAGLGFSPNVTIARELERVLARALPERDVTVVNLGIVALPAKKVALLVDDVLAHAEPDLLVVYSGNNEFLELHAERFAAARAGALGRAREALLDTNLHRLVRPPRAWESAATPLDLRDLAENDRRVSESAMIRVVEVAPDEVAAVHDAYEASLRGMARAAREADVPLVLCTVAANWEWRGREDLPASWPADELGLPVPAGPDGWRAVEAALGERLAAADDPAERSPLLFRRGLARRALGDVAGARDDLRAACDADPHLRRATSPMAERARRAAREEGALLADVVAALAADADDGVVGFAHLYDYVHLTPRGAAVAAACVAEAVLAGGDGTPPLAGARPVDLEAFVAERRAAVEGLARDPHDVREWLGVGDDVAGGIADRDLWKHHALLERLDDRLARDPRDADALVWRGNAAFFRQDGAADAERDWRAALEALGGSEAVEASLARLAAERRAPARAAATTKAATTGE